MSRFIRTTIFVVFALSSSGVFAQSTIVVDTIANTGTTTGNCEFLEALQAAETNLAVDGCIAGSNPDTIEFATALTGQTIVYSTTPVLTSGEVIIDSKMKAITLQALGTADAFEVSGASLTVKALDIRASTSGNGFTVTAGDVAIDNCSVQGRLGINAFGSPSSVSVNNSTVASTESSPASDIGIRSGGMNNLSINHGTIVATVGTGLDVASSSGSANVYSSVIVGATPINGSLTTSAGGMVQASSATNAGLASTLAYNGGPTRTFALLSGSAIEGGSCASAAFPQYDQRFYLNHLTGSRLVGTACDVGAYEKDAQEEFVFVDGFD